MADKKIITNITSAQPKIWNQLQKIHISKQIGSAYFFSGPSGCGKEGIALQFAQLLNCEDQGGDSCMVCSSCKRFLSLQHENLKLIFPLPVQKSPPDKIEGFIGTKDLDNITNSIAKKSKDPFYKIKIPKATRIPIQSIRLLRKSLYLRKEKNGRQVVIVFDSHLLSEGQSESGNAFLKLLEEPPEQTTIVLVSDHSELLLPTIISRCQIIRFPKLADEYVNNWLQKKGVQNEALALLTSLSRGNIHQANFISSQSLDELVMLIGDLIKIISQNKPDGWRSFIRMYSKMATQDYIKLSFHFYLLKIWFQSANRLMKNLDDTLHKTSLKPGMLQVITKYPTADFCSITLQLEEVLRAKSRNRYMPLVLINFLINTQKLLNQ